MRFLPGLFENLAPHVDGIVALDDQSTDGSAAFVAEQPLVVELLRVAPGSQEELEDGKNHWALTEAAWEHDPDWLLGIDADERVERSFRERAEREIDAAEARRHDAVWVRFRELWDAPDRFRCDGIWGAKRKACLFRARRDHQFDTRRVHAVWASQHRPDYDWLQADLNLYHLRMVRAEDRAARVGRYRRVDPDRIWQGIGYDYLLDEAGLELAAPEPGRDYVPLGR